ncbi:NAD(P)/FAD-dependent oxidoreductase [Streptomyces laculatispora]|uniref:NAD(P)/FAD-dependent oxidoreductase n=1 Tax=Streptomyces laculatispora TaxID=887464 RepID=UPI001A93F759|nr:NAD(P)/FAD-dependent oxidoreductase [Streptomyces laculatispora]MBO0914528.1 FAD-dependent oxidoreductase [Streptomyces laculatispora]
MANPAGPRPDAIVIGAGAAGLACATDLAAAGLSVHLLEASDEVGGRMRTDRRDGFLLDRGFQVFNTSYPQVKKRLALRDLRLHPFTPGVLVQTGAGGTGRVRFSDPTRRPGAARDLFPGRLASGRDLMALAVLSARDMFGPVSGIRRRPDRTTLTELADAGISDELVRTLFQPFLSGVFLEDELETSSRVFHLVWRSMLRGSLCLPAAGIGAVPAALAAGLPPRSLFVDTPVHSLTDDGVLGEDGSERPAPAVVVATGPERAAQLLPGLTVPGTRTVTTYYHVAGSPPLREPTLLVDSRRRFLNTVVLSEVVPACASTGYALVSTSVLGPDSPGRETRIRRDLAEVHATDTAAWDLLATYSVPGALPAMPPPWPLSRTSRVGPGRYVCGDHRATGSVQGALASGARAAREVLADRV